MSRPAPVTRRLRFSAVAVLFLTALLAPVLAPSAASADEIGDKREQARQVANDLYEIQGTLLELDRTYSEASAALEEANGHIAEAQSRVDATTAELAEQRKQFQTFAVQAYVGGNETPEFEALLTSNGDEAPQKASYLHAASGNRRDLQDRLRATGERLDGQIADLEADKADAQAHVDEMSAARDESQKALDAQQAIKSQIDGELDVLVQQEQARMQAEIQAQAQAAAQRQAAEDAARQQAAAQARTQTATTNPAPAPTSTGTTGGTGTTPTVAAPSTPTAPSAPSAPSTPTPTVPAPPVIVDPPTAPPPSGGAGAAVAAAQSALGVPYVPGGKGMSGFDCSGLTSWAWAKGGKSLPPTTYGQWASGSRVSLDALQPGDLVFYAGVSHVGIYVGGGSIIHAPNSRSVVRYDSVYWWGPIDGAVRP